MVYVFRPRLPGYTGLQRYNYLPGSTSWSWAVIFSISTPSALVQLDHSTISLILPCHGIPLPVAAAIVVERSDAAL